MFDVDVDDEDEDGDTEEELEFGDTCDLIINGILVEVDINGGCDDV